MGFYATSNRRRIAAIMVLVALVALPWLLQAIDQSFYVSLASRMLIFALAATSLNLVIGFGGMVSFGHAAYFGIGAYCVAILAEGGIVSAAYAWPAAIGVAALLALLIGALSLRTRGVYFIMITLAFAQMVYYLVVSLKTWGGDDGLTIHTRTTLFGLAPFAHTRLFYYIALGCLAGCYVLCRALVVSRFGRVFRGARENATRMATLGYDIYRYQLTAYAISGALGGLAGFLLANATDFVSPAYMSWQRSGELIIMILFGGLGTLHGAIVGALAYVLLGEWLSDLTENWKMIFGPMLVLVVLLARGGLIGLATQLMPHWTRKKPEPQP